MDTAGFASQTAARLRRTGSGRGRRSLRHLYGERRGHLVLEDVDLTLRDNEIVALLGRSGCGKSTLLRIIAGLMPADVGNRDDRRRAVSTARPAKSPWCSRALRCFPG